VKKGCSATNPEYAKVRGPLQLHSKSRSFLKLLTRLREGMRFVGGGGDEKIGGRETGNYHSIGDLNGRRE